MSLTDLFKNNEKVLVIEPIARKQVDITHCLNEKGLNPENGLNVTCVETIGEALDYLKKNKVILVYSEIPSQHLREIADLPYFCSYMEHIVNRE